MFLGQPWNIETTMFKQLLVLVAALFLVIGSLLGCGDSAPKNETDWTYGPPADFKQQDKDKNGATVFLADKDQDFTAYLQVKAGVNPYDSPQKIAQVAIGKAVNANNATVKEQETYTIPDSEAYTWLITQIHNGIQVSQRQFIVKKNKIVVLFTLTATTNTMDRYDQELAESLKSFKWGRQ